MPRALLPLLTLLLCAPAAHAQSGPPVDPGDRVRVLAPALSPRPLTGRVTALEADTLRLLWVGGTLAIPLGAVERMEVSRGGSRLRSAVRGAGAGAVGGAALGVAACLGVGGECTESADGALFLASTFALLGAPIGGVVGFVRGGERWSTLPLRAAESLRAAPHRGGVALSVQLAF